MAGKKAGRKQESGRPGSRHDAAPGRILGGHSSGIWLGGSFGVLALGLSGPVSLKQGTASSTDGTAG